MTYNESAAVVYRIVSAYPFYSRHISDEMLTNMVREWHEGLKDIEPMGVMEAVTALVTEQKWMPSLSEVITKVLDIQYGTDEQIIAELNRLISASSTYIIFGQITPEQTEGYNNLTPFQQLIVRSPADFNLWLSRDYEWKAERVKLVKRQITFGSHKDFLNGSSNQLQGGFDVFKALEERKKHDD